MSENTGSQQKLNLLSYLLAVLLGIGIGGIILLLNKQPKPEMIKILPTETKTPLVAHIVGEVRDPGIYELPAGARISDLVTAAGGFSDTADTTAVNLAGILWDGQQIFIPSIPSSDTTSTNDNSPGNGTDIQSTNLININYGSKEELMTLPGIGETKAEAIISYREQYGGFEVIEDIMKVSGIGEGIFESIKDKITVK